MTFNINIVIIRYGFNSEGHNKVYSRLKVREVEPPVKGNFVYL